MTISLQAAAAPAGGNYSFIIMMVLFFGVMYFFMIRPQQKRQKELNNFRNSLDKGMKVVTAGGLFGTVKEVTATDVSLEVANNVVIRIEKSMIMRDPADIAAQQK